MACAFFMHAAVYAANTTLADSDYDNESQIIYNCEEKNNPIFTILNDRVTEAIKVAKWGKFQLIDNVSLAIEFQENIFLITNTYRENSIVTYTKNLIDICKQSYMKDKNNNLIFLKLEIDKQKFPILKDQIPFKLINTASNIENKEIQIISSIVGKILLIKLKTESNIELEELQRTIIHEGFHLFGQQELFFNEPAFDQKYENSREFLLDIPRTSKLYAKQVQNELCISYEIIKSIINKNKIILQREFYKKHNHRINKFQTLYLENYWNEVEGIPEYLDHQILIKYSPQRLVSLYKSACETPIEKREFFFPNYLGALILHISNYKLNVSGIKKTKRKDRKNKTLKKERQFIYSTFER